MWMLPVVNRIRMMILIWMRCDRVDHRRGMGAGIADASPKIDWRSISGPLQPNLSANGDDSERLVTIRTVGDRWRGVDLNVLRSDDHG